MKDGTLRVDLFTASAITQALDKVKPDTKKKDGRYHQQGW